MLDANSFAALLIDTGSSMSQVGIGTVTATSGTTIQFVLDGEVATAATRSAATFKGFTMSNASTGARVVVCRINASYVALGILN